MTTHNHDHHAHGHDGSCCGANDAGSPAAVVRDPVCGMTVDPKAGKPRLDHEGHVYHFCSASCRDRFAAAPQDFVTATDPVCGMEVERATAALERT
jgi:P-type Cu+ transporter